MEGGTNLSSSIVLFNLEGLKMAETAKSEYCTRCEEDLKPGNEVWLEHSNTDGTYYKQIPEGHVSQGLFPFGSACAKTQLREDKDYRNNN